LVWKEVLAVTRERFALQSRPCIFDCCRASAGGACLTVKVSLSDCVSPRVEDISYKKALLLSEKQSWPDSRETFNVFDHHLSEIGKRCEQPLITGSSSQDEVGCHSLSKIPPSRYFSIAQQ